MKKIMKLVPTIRFGFGVWLERGDEIGITTAEGDGEGIVSWKQEELNRYYYLHFSFLFWTWRMPFLWRVI